MKHFTSQGDKAQHRTWKGKNKRTLLTGERGTKTKHKGGPLEP
jgi:hypothetical protein